MTCVVYDPMLDRSGPIKRECRADVKASSIRLVITLALVKIMCIAGMGVAGNAVAVRGPHPRAAGGERGTSCCVTVGIDETTKPRIAVGLAPISRQWFAASFSTLRRDARFTLRRAAFAKRNDLMR